MRSPIRNAFALSLIGFGVTGWVGWVSVSIIVHGKDLSWLKGRMNVPQAACMPLPNPLEEKFK